MSTIVNARDVLLQGAATRLSNPANAAILLVASTPAFHIAVGGANDPASITFTASLVALEGTVVFGCTGGTVTTAGNVATLTYANMSAATAIVSATVTVNGATVTSNSCFVTKVFDGSVGSTGDRGAGHFYATGGSWSDATANTATPGANVVDDVVTISNGSTFVSEKKWSGSAWVAMGTVLDGSLLVTGSVTAVKINGNGLDIHKADGTLILDAGGTGLQAGFEAPGTLNSDLIPLSAVGSSVVTGNQVEGSTADSTWVGGGRSIEGFAGGVFCSASPMQAGSDMMFGLTSVAAATTYGQLNFGIYLAGGSVRIYESGTDLGSNFTTYAANDKFEIRFDRANVYYRKNGAVFHSHAATTTSALYFFVDFYSGGKLGSIKIGPQTSSNFAEIGGTTKPANNATVGAPAGTYVGTTLATDVELQANYGGQAYNAVNDTTTGLAQRMRLNADNILGGIQSANVVSAPAGFRAGNVLWNAAGAWVSGSGVAMTPTGLVGYNSSGVAQFSINASTGAAVFAGALSAATGDFGAVTIAAGGSISSGQTAYNTGIGWHLSYIGGVPKLSVGNSSGNRLTFDGTNMEYVGAVQLPAFTVTITGTLDSTKSNTLSATGIGTLTASVTGGRGTLSYQWSVSTASTSPDNEIGLISISSPTASSTVIKAQVSASDTSVSGLVTLTVRDQDQRAPIATKIVSVQFGSPR